MPKVVEFQLEEEDTPVVEVPSATSPKVVVQEEEPVTLTPATKRARVKGSWLQVWGPLRFQFEDGKYYDLPHDLFDYLRQHGNIYDTLA